MECGAGEGVEWREDCWRGARRVRGVMEFGDGVHGTERLL